MQNLMHRIAWYASQYFTGFRIFVRFKHKTELLSKTNIDRLSIESDALVLPQVIYFIFLIYKKVKEAFSCYAQEEEEDTAICSI
jgi:hypothetical protein